METRIYDKTTGGGKEINEEKLGRGKSTRKGLSRGYSYVPRIFCTSGSLGLPSADFVDFFFVLSTKV